MNPDFPQSSRDEIEQRLTALLLGELSAEEAAALHRAMEQDGELAKMFARLHHAAALMRETEKTSEETDSETATQRKLSEARREKLLAHFKTVTPKEIAAPVRRERSHLLLAVAATIVICGLLAATLLPTVNRAKTKSSGNWSGVRTERYAMSAVERVEGDQAAEGVGLIPVESSSIPVATPEPARTLGYFNADAARDKNLLQTPAPDENLSERKALNFGRVSSASSVNRGTEVVSELEVTLVEQPAASLETRTFTVAPEKFYSALGLAGREVNAPSSPGTRNDFLVPRVNVTGGAGGGGASGGYLDYQKTNGVRESRGGNELAFDRLGEAKQQSDAGIRLAESGRLMPRGEAAPSRASRSQILTESDEYQNEFADSFKEEVIHPRNQESDDKVKALSSGEQREVLPRLLPESSLAKLTKEPDVTDQQVAGVKKRESLDRAAAKAESDRARDIAQLVSKKSATNAPIPQPEILTSENNFSTFSLNVSDVSFKLAAASLDQGQLPDRASIRSEEFINTFDYRDPEPRGDAPISFAWERARYPFAHGQDLLRFSLKTAATGRQAGRPLNVVLLLDNSGSMERADRVRIVREALRVLVTQLQSQDKLSVVTFARTARLVADGIAGDQAATVVEQVSGLTPQGGTNLEAAMRLAYETAARHYVAGGINRVVLLTDGAANLGEVEPESLKQHVEARRKQGIALDCFGIGWEGLNDNLLETLSRNGDGRYGFVNSPEEAASDFVGQLAGALQVAASDVKVQVEFNPARVTSYRQIGYAKHQLTQEQFRDNTVDAAEIAAQEAGNALYVVAVNPTGTGPLGTVRVRYKVPGTTDYREQAWDVPYTGQAISLEQASAAMRLAASASAFSEWLAGSPYAADVKLDELLELLRGVPETYGADPRPQKLEWMIRQAKRLSGE